MAFERLEIGVEKLVATGVGVRHSAGREERREREGDDSAVLPPLGQGDGVEACDGRGAWAAWVLTVRIVAEKPRGHCRAPRMMRRGMHLRPELALLAVAYVSTVAPSERALSTVPGCHVRAPNTRVRPPVSWVADGAERSDPTRGAPAAPSSAGFVPGLAVDHVSVLSGCGVGSMLAGMRRMAGRAGLRRRPGLGLLRMDVGDNSMGERVQAKQGTRRPAIFRQDMDALASQYQLLKVPDGEMPSVANVYNWSALGLGMEDGTLALDDITAHKAVRSKPSPSSFTSTGAPRQQDSEEELLKVLARLKAEHSDINEISDQLAVQQMGGAPAIHIQQHRAALKKRKLMLKDQMASISARLARVQQARDDASADFSEESEESEEATGEDGGATEAVQRSELDLVNDRLMLRLKELGLRPDAVPPHKDSFFLSLMKALQLAGLRPRNYDFRESAVMGSTTQFPWAAKRARQDVMALLSSQVHKLNGIGGWKLSSAEFKRYFSAAWWHVPAARHDLFMASAHLYSIRIVCLSIVEQDGIFDMVEEVYDPPFKTQAKATITLCRRGMHVISTTPDKNLADPFSVFAPPNFDTLEEQGKGDETAQEGQRNVDQRKMIARDPEADAGLVHARLEASATDDDTSGLMSPLEYADSALTESWPDGGLHLTGADSKQESSCDEEATSDAAHGASAVLDVYDTHVATKRVFVTLVLKEEAAQQCSALVANLREQYPLDSKQLDELVHWIDPASLHVTLHTLDVPVPRLEQAQEMILKTIRDLELPAFSLETGEVGCFWRSAGSSWGRVPRVIWLGLADSPGLHQLVKVHRALDRACLDAELSTDTRPLVAHITLAKTKNTQQMTTQQRRTLRGFGKWMQDQERPLHLQQLLEGESTRGKGGGKGGGRSPMEAKKRRGGKRHKSWIAGGGKGARHHVWRQRDLGALNSELVSEQTGGAGSVRGDDVELLDPVVHVDAIHVLEAVKMPGSKYVTYDTLLEIPLGNPSDPAQCAPGSPASGPARHQQEAGPLGEAAGETPDALQSSADPHSMLSDTTLSAQERDSIAELLETDDEFLL